MSKNIKKIGTTAAIAGAALSAGMISSNHNVKADTVSTTNQSQALHNDQQAAVKTSAQSKIAAAKSAVSSAQSRVDQTKPAADAAQSKIDSAQSTVNADQSKVSSAQSAVNSANQQISQKKATIASDQSKVSSIKSEISNAQQNLPSAQKSAQAASQQAQQAQNKANAAKATMDSAQSKVNDLTNQKNQTQDKINSLSQGTNLPAAQKAVSDAQNAVSNAQSKLSNDQNKLTNDKNDTSGVYANNQYGGKFLHVKASPEQEAEWDNGVTLTQQEQEALDTLNLYRMSLGLSPVKIDANLESYARQRAQNVNANDPHAGFQAPKLTSSDFDSSTQMYGDSSECWTPEDPNEDYAGGMAVYQWLNEEPSYAGGHRASCLDPEATYVGIGSSTQGFMMDVQDTCSTSSVFTPDNSFNNNDYQTYTGDGAITPVPLTNSYQWSPLTKSQVSDLNMSINADDGAATHVDAPANPNYQETLEQDQNNINNDQANLTAAQNQLTNAQNALNAAEESAAQKSAQIKNLQNTLNNINSELNNAQDALNQAKNNYNSAESAAQTAQANADKLNNEVKQMQDALNNGQNEINQLENQIKQLENTPDPDVAALQNDLTNAQNALKDAQTALAQAKQDGAAPIAAYNQALNDLKNAEAQLNQAEQEAAAQKRAQEIAAANQAHKDLDGTALPAGAYIKPNGDIISATGKLIGKDGILFGTTAHFASDINNGTTLKSGTKVYFGNNTVEAAEVPTKNATKKALPDTGDAQNTKAEEAGIVALGLAGLASAFGFAKRKKRD